MKVSGSIAAVASGRRRDWGEERKLQHGSRTRMRSMGTGEYCRREELKVALGDGPQ